MRTSVGFLVVSLAFVLPAGALAQEGPALEVDPAVGAELGAIDHRLQSLRADLDRSSARLQLLLGDDAAGGARIAITHENHMSPAYRLTRVQYALDGQVVFSHADADGSLAGRARFDVFDGALVPGAHVLTVTLDYLGSGYDVFDYAHGYRYRLHSSTVLSIPPGGDMTLHVVGWEAGGPTAAMSDRPAIRFQAHVAGRDER